MQTAEVSPAPDFAGSGDEQQLASEVFHLMRGMGRFFSKRAPIRTSLESISAHFAAQRTERSADEWAAELQRALELNPDVFVIVDQDGVTVIMTTHDGKRPSEGVGENLHTFARRFQEPVPVREGQSPSDRLARGPRGQVSEVEPLDTAGAVTEAPAEPTPVEDFDEAPVAAEPAAPTEDAQVVDPGDLDADTLAELVVAHLSADMKVASFGDLWLAEDKTPGLSRGDLRRIRDYIVERNEPLSTDVLLQDVLNVRPNADQFDLMKFGLNYRLSQETRDYEFVGTPDNHLWSTPGLQPIGTTKRKASDIGQEYRFLVQERPAVLNREETVAEHVLTFYEYLYGVLPLDQTFEALFPPVVLPGQRAAILTFEAPQSNETFSVELRYPTGNRGGYVAGFEKFFAENLVPGALVTIERNDDNGRYLIEFLPVSGEDQKLLHLDEKKGRFLFRPTTFYCATQENMLLSENRFARLAKVEVLDDRSRRRPELALAATFERVGEREGTGDDARYMAMLDDLVPVANIERPMSAHLIRSLADSPQFPEFTSDTDVDDVFYYRPTGE